MISDKKTVSRYTTIIMPGGEVGSRIVKVPQDVNVFRATFQVNLIGTPSGAPQTGIAGMSNIPITIADVTEADGTPVFLLVGVAVTGLVLANNLILDRRGEGAMSDQLYFKNLSPIVEPAPQPSIRVNIVWEGYVKEGYL